MDYQAMSLAELRQVIVDSSKELNSRMLKYIERVSTTSTLTKEELDDHCNRGRAAYSLSLADWARVSLAMREVGIQDSKEGCIRFMPIITPFKEEKTDEYRELFEYRKQ